MSDDQHRRRTLLVLGQAVRQVREEQGWKTDELAVATGIAQAQIQALEAGRLDPDYDLLLALAEGLGVRPSALFIRAEELQAPRAPEGDV